MSDTRITDYQLERLIARKLVMSSSELILLLRSRTQVKRKADVGILIPVGSGIYCSPSIDPFSARILAAIKFYPGAVISNITALVIHGLSDESLDLVDIDIDNRTCLRNQFLRVHRVSKRNLIGRTTLSYQGKRIRIYNIERSLCDAYKRDSEGAIFFKALKRYAQRGKFDTIRLAKYDRILGTEVSTLR